MERKCKNCKKLFKTYPSRVKNGKGKFCGRSCSSSYNNRGKKNHFSKDRYFGKGEKSSRWKGGTKKERGYILVYKPSHPFSTNGYVRQHRLVMEKKMGRHLKPKEIVHHMNHNKSDNRPENLMLMNGSDH